MSWAWRRRLIYLSILAILVVAPVTYFTVRALHHVPTCFDSIQNQNELGVDCGGTCTLLCYAESIPPVLHWSRVFKVGEGIYIAAAYIENPNEAARAVDKPYELKVFDAQGVPIYTRTGKVSLDPKEFTAVIESGILLDKLEGSTVRFEWVGNQEGWVRATAQPLAVEVRDVRIDVADGTPAVTANISNPTLTTFRNFEVAALVYGADGNAIGVSRTYVDRLDPDQEREVIFTWPKPFEAEAVEAEVLPKL